MHASVFPLLAASIGSASAALQVDLGSHSSIQTAAKDVAFDAVSFYKGNKTGEVPGILGLPPTSTNQDGYWWWTGSVFWSTLIDHWRYTGDDTYNGLVSQGLLHQAGEDNDFMHPNWTTTLAEDDLGFWGMAAMQAAELNFPAPGQNGLKSWLDLASNVFESKAFRLNAGNETCNGGFRWQIFPINNGYNYKNAISAAVFINLGGRLARYTGNETYSKLAESSWVWLTEVGFIDDKNNVFDGGHVERNCTDINTAQFSYTPAVLLEAAAHLYNHTTGEPQTRWRNRLDGMTKRTLELFFENGTHFEVTCEGRRGACNSDMLFFKGITLRALANVAQLAPRLHDEIFKTFKTNAELAVKVCTGGDNGRLCGFSWLEGENDGLNKIPSELNALSALEVLLIDDVARKGLSTASQSNSSSGNGNGNGNSGGNSQQKLAGSAGSATRAAAPMLLAGLFAALM